jgi:predicted nucleic acid-binding protein
MAFLLDTNVLSELRKGLKCDAKVRAWAVSSRHAQHWISVLSLGEVRKGIELLRKKSPSQCPAFESWLIQLETTYDGCILTVTDAIADEWGRLQAKQTMPVVDSLIAATALVHKLTIVTRNTNDFAPSGANLLNPFL